MSDEKGNYATIPVHWGDGGRTLTFGDRKGSFRGMLQGRTFQVVFVRDGHGAGVAPTETPDAIVHYSGKATAVRAGAGERVKMPR